jgi:hypothetical protein
MQMELDEKPRKQRCDSFANFAFASKAKSSTFAKRKQNSFSTSTDDGMQIDFNEQRLKQEASNSVTWDFLSNLNWPMFDC